jgi:hypothetical protein
MGNRHVVPDGDKWRVVAPGAQRASARTDTQAQAIDRARDIIRNSGGGELVVQGENGRIRQKDTIPPAKDKFPPRG